MQQQPEKINDTASSNPSDNRRFMRESFELGRFPPGGIWARARASGREGWREICDSHADDKSNQTQFAAFAVGVVNTAKPLQGR
jgi:hypothetical protein